MRILQTINFILKHPLNHYHKFTALKRWFLWQVGSRLVPGPVAVPFVNSSRLLVSPGMTGATGNVYCGLHEFEDMAFVLHFLRLEDLFVDIGANIGSYTVLASSAIGAESIAIEPIPATYRNLLQNIHMNALEGRVASLNIGLSAGPGQLSFTAGQDTVNHVTTETEKTEGKTVAVKVDTLDNVLDGRTPALIKIDVEGFEAAVIDGGNCVLSDKRLHCVVMELNGSGARYGFDEAALHGKMLDYGFKTFSYSPFERKLISLEQNKSVSGNTLYIKNLEFVKDRIATAPQFRVHGHLI